MSTASGNPPHVVELSEYANREAAEPQAGEPHDQIEVRKEDNPRSAYAPKPAHERAAARARGLDSEQDKISPFIPRRRRSPKPDGAAGPELSSPASVASPDEAAAAGAASTSSLPTQVVGAARKDAAQPDLTQKHVTAEQQDSEIRGMKADRHVEQIEATLRLLQRQQGAPPRLPRGPNLVPPPEPILASPGASGDAYRKRGGLFAGLPSPRSLDPTPLSPPSLPPARNVHAILGVAIACIAGVIAGYWLVDAPISRPVFISPPAVRAQAALTPPSPLLVNAIDSSQAESDGKPEWWLARATGLAKEDSEIGKQPESGTPRVATLSPAPAIEVRAAVPPPSPKQAERRILRPDEIQLLIEQGEKFMAAGDIVSARMMFERAAQGEDATAALALGAAYDPLVLSKLGVMGTESSLEKARIWYAKAQSLGSTQAIARLKALEDR
jgi:hypothetical protein